MNPRCPMTTLSVAETTRLRCLIDERGERAALDLVGLRSAETLYRAASGVRIAVLTAEVIRGRLDRI